MASELPPDPYLPEGLDLDNQSGNILQVFRLDLSGASEKTDSGEASASIDNANGVIHPALSLALFGWQAEEGHISGLATCTACFRRLGLWLFKSPTDSTATSSMERLDVVAEHRDYCPWVNVLSQNGLSSRRSSLEGLAGWEILLRAVKASAIHKKYDEAETTPAAPDAVNEAASEVASVASSTPTKEDRENQDEKDKERWAKLKKLKQVFHVKKGKSKDGRGPTSKRSTS